MSSAEMHGDHEAADPELLAQLMKRLVGLGEALNRPSSVAGVSAAIGRAALSLIDAQRVAVYLRSPTGVVTCPWSQSLSPEYIAQVVTPTGANPWAHLARHPELVCMDLPKGRRGQGPDPTLLRDIGELPQGNEVRRLAEQEGFKALGSWPLIRAGRVIASVSCYYDASRVWPPPEQEVMLAFASQAASALESALLSEDRRQRTGEPEAESTGLPGTQRQPEAESARLFDGQGQLEAENARLSDAQMQLQDENTRLREIQRRLEAEKARLAEAQRQLETEAARLPDTMRERIAELEAENARLAEGHEQLEAEAARLQEIQRQLKAENARLAGAQRQLEAENARLSGTQPRLEAENARLSGAQQQLEAENARLSGAQQRLEAEIARLSGAQQQLEAENARLSEVQKQTEAGNARPSEAQRQLQDENARLQEIQKQLEAANARLSETQRQLEATNARLSETQRQPVAGNSRPYEGRMQVEAANARPSEVQRPQPGMERPHPPETQRQQQAESMPPPEALKPRKPESVPPPEALKPRKPESVPPPETLKPRKPETARPPEIQRQRKPEHARPSDARGRLAAEFEDLYELRDQLSGEHTPDEICQILADRAVGLLRADHGVLTPLSPDELALTLARALDASDGYGAGYSERLARWVEATARTLGCREDEIKHIRWAALLHDIGKICVPVAILRKPGTLTDEERTAMRQEPVAAEKILKSVKGMQEVAKGLRHHYEKWDGTGYPDGLKEGAIPLGARILAVVEAYSEMTTERPGKLARYHLDAVAELKRGAGTQFEPRVVDAFCRALQRERDQRR